MDEKTFEVEVFVDGMEYPEIGTLEIQATSAKAAVQWVKDNIRLSATEI